MKPNYLVYDEIYIKARNDGVAGWGGANRIAKGSIFVSKFLDSGFRLPIGELLELGCGEGHHSRLFAERGYKVSGVDVSQAAISWAQEKADALSVSAHYYVADLTLPNLALPSNYQVIVDGNCFHCIIGEDREVFLSNVYSALAHKGVFFVSSLCSKTDKDQTIFRQGVPYRHIGTVSSVVAELEGSGFLIKKVVEHVRSEHNHVNIHTIKNAK